MEIGKAVSAQAANAMGSIKEQLLSDKAMWQEEALRTARAAFEERLAEESNKVQQLTETLQRFMTQAQAVAAAPPG